ALVHHITNWVTINDCAQIVRHWGCLPVMAHAVDEVAEMAGLAGALVLNIGTLTPELVEAMLVAAKAANAKGIPVLVDAVGAGATRLRTNESKRLLEEAKVDILKGNAGEIATLAGVEAEVRGVESISVDGDIGATAKALAATLGNVVAVTGEKDVVTDGRRVFTIKGGHPLMGRVVGTGCISTSTVGCFATAGGDLIERTGEALGCFGLAGERAAKVAKGPGDFMGAFFNEIARLSERPTGIKFDVGESG
ncbi:MAG: hydroxyethylthiazole kinase, partial [Planctomycetota bacterium]